MFSILHPHTVIKLVNPKVLIIYGVGFLKVFQSGPTYVTLAQIRPYSLTMYRLIYFYRTIQTQMNSIYKTTTVYYIVVQRASLELALTCLRLKYIFLSTRE